MLIDQSIPKTVPLVNLSEESNPETIEHLYLIRAL